MKHFLRALLLLTAAALSFPAGLPAQDPAPSAQPAPPAPPAEARAPADVGDARDEPGLRRSDERARRRQARRDRWRGDRSDSSIVNILGDSHLPAGEQAEAVVSILGSATAEGVVSDAVVSILGNTRVTGPVGDSAVAILGNVYVNSPVDGDVVAVVGDVELGPEAVIDGEVVCVLGQVTRDPAAIVEGGVHAVGMGGGGVDFRPTEELTAWIRQCLLLGRPLAFGPHLGWAWVVAGVFVGVLVLFAVFFREGIERCVQTLATHPGSSVVTAMLTVLLSPVAIVLLIMTGIGIFLVPFVGAGLFAASLFGTAAVLAWLGLKVTRFFGDSPLGHPAFAVLVAGAIILLVYTVPVLGLLTLKLLGWLGLGVVLFTLIHAMKKERTTLAPAGARQPVGTMAAPMSGVEFAASGSQAVPPLVTESSAPPPPAGTPPIVSAATLPRAGFWIRLLALAIDLIVVAIVMATTVKALPYFTRLDFGQGILPLVAIYGAVLWKLRGTTIGGIVCGLKVVRLDDRPIDWATAIVRTLGCFLSLFVAGLGFIWVAIDEQQQSWHDKIAGTTVVRVPKGISLV